MRNGPICIIGGHTPSLLNFRGALLRELRARGYDVLAVGNTHDDAVIATLAQQGVRFEAVALARAGLNPLHDLQYARGLARLLRHEQPAVVLSYTHKPIIYSSFAVVRACPSARVFAMVTGLGFAFVDDRGYKRKLARWVLTSMYRRASRTWAGAIFQNPDDRHFFVRNSMVPKSTPQVVVRGSGVDLSRHAAAPVPTAVRFLLIARLLVDKGVREYAAAARNVRTRYPSAEFHLVGPLDANPTSIGASELQSWVDDGLILYHGELADVRPRLQHCTVFVLPSSYGEGTPRTILEAMATGRAIITTDAPGCRETVFGAGPADLLGVAEGSNGFLVPPRSSEALAAAMLRVLEHPEKTAHMGAESRRLAEAHYDVDLVNRDILKFMGLDVCVEPV